MRKYFSVSGNISILILIILLQFTFSKFTFANAFSSYEQLRSHDGKHSRVAGKSRIEGKPNLFSSKKTPASDGNTRSRSGSWVRMKSHSSANAFSSYKELRSYRGESGQVVSIDTPRIAGNFQFFSSSEMPISDDGGIIIRARNGSWVRMFDYSSDHPINLDWFELKERQEITPIIEMLAEKYAPNLYLRLPSRTMTLVLDTIDLSAYGIEDFYLLESNRPVVIRQKELCKDLDKLIILKNYKRVKIGGNGLRLTFRGLHRGVRGGHNAKADNDVGYGLISFEQSDVEGEFLNFAANIKHSRIYGIDHRGSKQGSSGRTKFVSISGNFINSGLRLNSGIKEIALSKLRITDPYGVQFGWDGANALINNNGYNATPYYWERSRGLSITFADKVTGSVRLEYGWANWFMSKVERIGDGPNNPFVIRYKDLGYSASGERIRTEGFLDTGGKVDYIGAGQGKRFLRIVEGPHKYGFRLRNSTLFEATSEDGAGGTSYVNENIQLDLVNASSNINTAVLDYAGDFSRNHVISGNMVRGSKRDNPSRQPPKLTIFEGDTVQAFLGYHIVFDYKEKGGLRAHNNVVRNSRILSGGEITVSAGAHSNRIEKTIFEGSPRRVIHIRNMKAPHLPVSLALNSVKAPTGSTIEAEINQNILVTVDGVRVALPYVFK